MTYYSLEQSKICQITNILASIKLKGKAAANILSEGNKDHAFCEHRNTYLLPKNRNEHVYVYNIINNISITMKLVSQSLSHVTNKLIRLPMSAPKSRYIINTIGTYNSNKWKLQPSNMKHYETSSYDSKLPDTVSPAQQNGLTALAPKYSFVRGICWSHSSKARR